VPPPVPGRFYRNDRYFFGGPLGYEEREVKTVNKPAMDRGESVPEGTIRDFHGEIAAKERFSSWNPT
jgi:hypothetical protein